MSSWLAGEELRQRYEKPSGWGTTFAGRGGSPLPQKLPGAAAYWVPAGVLDDDPGLRIGGHIWVGSKAPWDVIREGDGPQFQEGLPPPEDELASAVSRRDAMADQSEALARVVDGRAWEEFCDTLKAAGAVVLAGPDDPLDRAEGWRYLSRLLRAGLETFVEASDASTPHFQRTTGETVKMGMDNPDNVYLNAPVNGGHDYRIWGTRGTVHYLGFGTQSGNYARRAA